jgi:hypothetical protein
MDDTSFYDYVRQIIERLLSSPLDFRQEVDGATYAITGSMKNSIETLKQRLVPELETENTEALSGRNTISDEILRKYIEITRSIRAFWFDNIDTHLLTIEKLSDQALAKRRAYERSRSGNGPLRADGKTTIDKPETKKDTSGDLLGQLKNMSPEQIAAILAALGKK